MSNSKGGRAAVLAILAGGLGMGVLAYYVKTTPQAVRVADDLRVVEHKREARPPTLVPPAEEPATPRRERPRPRAAEDTVRLPVFGDEVSDTELAKGATAVPEGQDAMRYVAQRVADAAHLDGARALGVDVRDHVAFVGYNDAVQKGMGSMEEGRFVYALRVAFGQFTDVDKVALEANGEPMRSGHFDLSQPLPVIRPGEKPTEEGEPKPGEP